MPSCCVRSWVRPSCVGPNGGSFDVTVLASMAGRMDVLLVGNPEILAAGAVWAGGHRCQRIPPTERRGRTHTSTVTVAWMPVLPPHQSALRPIDVEETHHHAGGPGGQHQNKTLSAVRLRHIPTGLMVDVRSERSQHQNRAVAWSLLSARLTASEREQGKAERASTRRRQLGTGQRGDKVMTWRWQDGWVTDHRSGSKSRLHAALDGCPPGIPMNH